MEQEMILYQFSVYTRMPHSRVFEPNVMSPAPVVRNSEVKSKKREFWCICFKRNLFKSQFQFECITHRVNNTFLHKCLTF